MIFIIGIVLWIICMYLMLHDTPLRLISLSDIAASVFFSTLISVLLSIIIWCVGLIICVDILKADRCIDINNPERIYELYKLEDNSTAYLSRYYNKNNLNINFVYLDEQTNGLKFKTISSDDAQIHFIDKDESPYAIQCGIRFCNSTLNTIFDVTLGNTYIIYIPEGSIIENYNIDLQ